MLTNMTDVSETKKMDADETLMKSERPGYFVYWRSQWKTLLGSFFYD